MDGEEDYLGLSNNEYVPSNDTNKSKCFEAQPSTSASGNEKIADLSDMTFCMGNYPKESMKVYIFYLVINLYFI